MQKHSLMNKIDYFFRNSPIQLAATTPVIGHFILHGVSRLLNASCPSKHVTIILGIPLGDSHQCSTGQCLTHRVNIAWCGSATISQLAITKGGVVRMLVITPNEMVVRSFFLFKDLFLSKLHCTKKKFSIKDFFSKFDPIRRNLRIWSHLLKKSLKENFLFCAVLSRNCSELGLVPKFPF